MSDGQDDAGQRDKDDADITGNIEKGGALSAVLRLGMVGGGPGSLIGPVHRMAAELDGQFRLVAGAFSSDAARSREAAKSYGIASERAYSDYRAMLAAERDRDDGIQVIAVAAPNDLHLPVALAALEAGMHVISDKPATATLREALILREVVRDRNRLYALTYTYTGYPMVRAARRLVAEGVIGRVRKVIVDYPQGWLSTPVERSGNKQASWRADPNRAGAGGCIGDIGVHAFNLAEYVSGERVIELCADLSQVIPDRVLDDDCNLLLRFSGGQPGILSASQISAGERNGLSLRIYGATGGLHWHQENPNVLRLEHLEGRTEVLHAGTGGSSEHGRLPPGHPEGFIEAFANIYRNFAAAVRGDAHLIGTTIPGIDAGVRSMRFIDCALESSRARRWMRLDDEVSE